MLISSHKSRIFLSYTEDPRYNDSVCYQRFCCKIEFAVLKKLDMDPSKASVMDTFEHFFYKSYVLCFCKNRLTEAILTNTQNVYFPEE